jgi:hypothetical protein
MMRFAPLGGNVNAASVLGSPHVGRLRHLHPRRFGSVGTDAIDY